MNALDLHRNVCVADAHADSLMWNRDLNRPSDEGHVDFPRLKEGGVRLQCFTIVTHGFPIIGGFPLFATYRGWPSAAKKSPWTRACWQIEKLHEMCAASNGEAAVTKTAAQLRENVAAGRLSGVLGVEGAQALEGQVPRVRELYEKGVRFMGLTHLSNNALGGSSFPTMWPKTLTSYGRAVLDEMANVGMSVDLAHASRGTLKEILAHPSARIMCSHTGVRAQGGGWRNLDDDVLRKVADRGGVVGIIFATVYLGGKGLEDVARHIEHALKVMGEDAVGFGSDYDGMVPLPRGMRDVRDLPKLTEVLLGRGIPHRIVEKVIGENWRRYFSETLGS